MAAFWDSKIEWKALQKVAVAHKLCEFQSEFLYRRLL
jgi:hypothetical protein